MPHSAHASHHRRTFRRGLGVPSRLQGTAGRPALARGWRAWIPPHLRVVVVGLLQFGCAEWKRTDMPHRSGFPSFRGLPGCTLPNLVRATSDFKSCDFWRYTQPKHDGCMYDLKAIGGVASAIGKQLTEERDKLLAIYVWGAQRSAWCARRPHG